MEAAPAADGRRPAALGAGAAGSRSSPQRPRLPRCLGSVAEREPGSSCLDHGHGHDPHGPFRVDELLAPTAQRESAAARQRLARRSQARRREPVALSFALPDAARSVRVVASASIIAATLAFLVK